MIEICFLCMCVLLKKEGKVAALRLLQRHWTSAWPHRTGLGKKFNPAVCILSSVFGSLRLCIDYCEPNRKTHPDHQLIQWVPDMANSFFVPREGLSSGLHGRREPTSDCFCDPLVFVRVEQDTFWPGEHIRCLSAMEYLCSIFNDTMEFDRSMLLWMPELLSGSLV